MLREYSPLKERHIPFEEAVMLRELGHPEHLWSYRAENRSATSSKIFYPDPDNSDECAQCGKHKGKHQQFDNKPFFCEEQKILAPLWQEAEELLWEKYKIRIPISKEVRGNEFISTIICEEKIIAQSVFNTPTIASREGIKLAIQYLHKQKTS